MPNRFISGNTGGNAFLSEAPPAELRSTTPSLRDRITNFISRQLGDDRESFRTANRLVEALELTPMGLATSADDAGRAAAAGDIPNALLGMMGAFPAAKPIRGGFRGMMRRAGNENRTVAERVGPPLSLEERTFQNFAKNMPQEEFLRSEPLWSGAQRIADERNIPFEQAFADLANAMSARTGTGRTLTPETAARFIRAERNPGIRPVE